MASPEVFVDTPGLYALVEKLDTHHLAARRVVGTVLAEGRKLVLTDYVIDESVTLAKARSGPRTAIRVLELIERSAGIRIEWITVPRFEATQTFFRKHADHAYSFTDCSSFVVMRELGVTEALTSDAHFSEAGFTKLLPARAR